MKFVLISVIRGKKFLDIIPDEGDYIIQLDFESKMGE